MSEVLYPLHSLEITAHAICGDLTVSKEKKMLKMRKISETTALRVYTDDGLYFGEIGEALLKNNKIESWKVRASRESFLSKALAGAKGVIVPHLMVKAIGDVMLVSRNAAPSYSEEAPAA